MYAYVEKRANNYSGVSGVDFTPLFSGVSNILVLLDFSIFVDFLPYTSTMFCSPHLLIRGSVRIKDRLHDFYKNTVYRNTGLEKLKN